MVIIVVDSLSKEIVDKYDMRNVEALMRDGVDTPRGYLGHTGSVTVVTHNVITSGQLPKHMGWTDEGYRDVAGILGDPEPANPDQLYITSNATTDLFKLQQAAGYPKLADYLGAADPTAKTFTISPKGYAGYAFGGAGSDSIITFSSGPECTTGGAWRKPSGINVPAYILGEPCSRFWVHSGYPLPNRSRPSPTTPPSCRRCSTRWTATAMSPAMTPPTRAVTCGRPTRPSRSCATTRPGTASSSPCRASTRPRTCGAAHPTRGRPAPTGTR